MENIWSLFEWNIEIVSLQLHCKCQATASSGDNEVGMGIRKNSSNAFGREASWMLIAPPGVPRSSSQPARHVVNNALHVIIFNNYMMEQWADDDQAQRTMNDDGVPCAAVQPQTELIKSNFSELIMDGFPTFTRSPWPVDLIFTLHRLIRRRGRDHQLFESS